MAKQKLKFQTSKAGGVDKIKKDMSAGKGNFGNMLWIKPDESKVFRILAEPKEWTKYHYVHVEETPDGKKLGPKGKLPCFEGYEKYIGGDEKVRVGHVIPVGVVNDDTGKADRFMFYQPTVGVLNDLLKHFDKRGTLCDRDFEVIREGKGMQDTRYTLMNDDPAKRKEIDKLAELDFDDELVRMVNEFVAAFEGEDEAEDEKPKKGKKAKPSARRVVEDDDEDEDDEPESEEDDDDEDDAEPEGDADYSDMDQKELAALAKKRGIEVVGRATAKKLRDALEAADSEGEAEEPEDDEDDDEDEGSEGESLSGVFVATNIDENAFTVDFVDAEGEVYETVYLDRSKHDIDELEEDGKYQLTLAQDEDEDWCVEGDIKPAKSTKKAGKKGK